MFIDTNNPTTLPGAAHLVMTRWPQLGPSPAAEVKGLKSKQTQKRTVARWPCIKGWRGGSSLLPSPFPLPLPSLSGSSPLLQACTEMLYAVNGTRPLRVTLLGVVTGWVQSDLWVHMKRKNTCLLVVQLLTHEYSI